jgi:hypothetical protein
MEPEFWWPCSQLCTTGTYPPHIRHMGAVRLYPTLVTCVFSSHGELIQVSKKYSIAIINKLLTKS